MEKIVRKIPARTSVSYRCSVCKTRYRSSKCALACEVGAVEPPLAIGTRVSNKETRSCLVGGVKYTFRGAVVAVTGPHPPDYDHWVRGCATAEWLRYGHIFKYEIRFKCPACGIEKIAMYYAPELTIIS